LWVILTQWHVNQPQRFSHYFVYHHNRIFPIGLREGFGELVMFSVSFEYKGESLPKYTTIFK